MRKILFAFIGLLFIFTGHAQINYNSANKQFILSSFNGNSPLIKRAVNNNPGSIPKTKASAFVLEYGDGYFTSDDTSVHAYKNLPAKPAILSLSGRYDTIKPPPAFAINIGDDTNTGGNPTQSMLNSGEYVRLTPIASSLNVRDEMLFILTYHLPQGKTSATLKLFYNEPSAIVFEPVNAGDLLPAFANASSSLTSVPRIRTYFNESPASIGFSASPSIGGTLYQNVITWTINDPAPIDGERNVFVTIRTKGNFTSQASINIEADLIFPGDGGKGSTPSQASPLNMSLSADPHDPNYIAALPRCIQTAAGFKKVDYRIHFQNEGGGQAFKVCVEAQMDPRLTDEVRKLKPLSFKIKVGNRPVNDFGYDTLGGGRIRFTIYFRKRGVAKDGSIIEGFDSTLSCNKVPVWFSNPLTMGDIRFQLDVPTKNEADLVGRAAINFYNQGQNIMDTVFTQPDTLFIRTECSGNLFPRIKPLVNPSSKPDPKPDPCTSCGCKTIFGICWWWVVAGAIALLIIIFLLVRKRK